MNELVQGDSVVRTIQYRADPAGSGLLQAVTKAAAYFSMYPPALYDTRTVSANFEDGVYRIVLRRRRLAIDAEVLTGVDVDLSKYAGRVEYVELLDLIHALKARVIETKRWKGRDIIKIERVSEDSWRVIEHRKDKDTGSIEEIVEEVDHDNVLDVWRVICQCADQGRKASYVQIVNKIIDGIRLLNPLAEVTSHSFNGGKYCRLYYFPLYYYPVKILEYLQFVKYHGRGGVTRIDKNEMELI